DGAGRFLPDLPAHLPAVQAGQHDVQQNQVRVYRIKHFQGGLAVVGDGGFVPLLFYIEPQKLADVGIVVHNQDFPCSHVEPPPFSKLLSRLVWVQCPKLSPFYSVSMAKARKTGEQSMKTGRVSREKTALGPCFFPRDVVQSTHFSAPML